MLGSFGVYQTRGTFLGVPIRRVVISWGLYWGPAVLQNYHIGLGSRGHKALTLSCLSVEIGLIEGPLLTGASIVGALNLGVLIYTLYTRSTATSPSARAYRQEPITLNPNQQETDT